MAYSLLYYAMARRVDYDSQQQKTRKGGKDWGAEEGINLVQARQLFYTTLVYIRYSTSLIRCGDIPSVADRQTAGRQTRNNQ